MQEFGVWTAGRGGDCAVLRVTGEVDVYTAPALRERLLDLAAEGAVHVVADMSRVDFLDSTGLGVLVGGLKRLREHDGSLTLVISATRILRLFEMTGLTRVFPVLLARFWAGVLGGEAAHDPLGGVAVRPGEDPGFRLRFLPTAVPKAGLNDRHFHFTSTSRADQQRTVAAALALGARPLDVGQRPEEGHVVLADPEGNEFCVIEPGNRFLAGCGFLGEVACDGSAPAGRFWGAALGWPLVWD